MGLGPSLCADRGGQTSGLVGSDVRAGGPDVQAGVVAFAALRFGGAGFPGRWPDVRALGRGRMSELPGPVAFCGWVAVEEGTPGDRCPGPGRCSWLLPLVLLIRGLGDLYIFMRIFGRALLVPNHAQHLGLR